MKKLLLLSLASLGFLSVNAQEPTENWCGTDQHNEQFFDASPELRNQVHEHLMRVTSGMYANDDREDDCIIPVVVHVLHDNGEGNISYEQIQSGLDMLNEDFNRENTDADDTRNTEDAPFAPTASDIGVRFELAKLDPNGNCTNGVQRRNVGSLSYDGGENSKRYVTGGLDQWNRNYYFNIWIVNGINSSSTSGTILGYAEFPYFGGSSGYGIIIRNDRYGRIGTAVSADRTLTHEVGHCFGLYHTFQGGCLGTSCDATGDYCCDTPPVVSAQWSCFTGQNTCDQIPSGDLYGFDAFDQFENYMSYSPCQNMYSKDQKDIVTGNLESISFLNSLIDPDNYSVTGVGTPDILCKAQFTSTKRTICAGETVSFNDDSYSNVTDRTWTFEGGTPSTSTEENPVITYETGGIFPVQLEVTDGISNEATTVERYVLVLPNPGTGLPYVENFESLSTIPDSVSFLIENEDQDDAWEISETIGYSGTQSAFLKNVGNNNGLKDALISNTIDLSGVDPDEDMIFSFKYAYKKRHDDDNEWLRFSISNDCGETWILRKNIAGDNLSEEFQSSSYAPESLDEWQYVEITSITPSYYVSGFRYKFEFKNDNGNNIYIDDINLYPASMAGLVKNENHVFKLSLFPNPANDILNINVSIDNQTDANVSLMNEMGQKIGSIYNGELITGKSTLSYNVQHLPTGVYFVQFTNDNGVSETTRFVKK